MDWQQRLRSALGFASAQAQHLDFAFHTLGWYQFQSLSVAILNDVLGQTVEVAASGQDAGIDAFFQGSWEPREGEELNGPFVVQAKYSRYAGHSLPLGILKRDCHKVAELAARGLCHNYLVFTNYTVNFTRKIALQNAIRNLTGVRVVKIFGPDQLTHWIKSSSKLRMMLPRVYGLGDLSQIIDERGRRQAVAILESFQSRLVTVVPTDAYKKAATALDQHNFVLLIGNPMTGKTTISYALALAALDHLGLNVFVLKHPDELKEHWDPLDPQRFYWIDDAFGQTQFDYSLATAWNRQMDRVNAAVDKGARFVLTTRTYIWNSAAKVIKRYGLPLLENSQVRIYVEELTRSEKSQILYHHLRMGTQPTAFKQAVHPNLQALAELREFLPEAARRLGNPFFTKSLSSKPSLDVLAEFFTQPLQILVDIVSQLDRPSLGLLAVIFSKGGRISAPLGFDGGDRTILESLGTTPVDAVNAAAALNESLIRRLAESDGTAIYAFAHPTVRDAVATIMGADPDLLSIYLTGVSIKDALSEVTCGDLNFHGVKVIVRPESYALFLERLGSFARNRKWDDRHDPTDFLLYRCDRAFLAFAIEHDLDLFNHLDYSNWVPQTDSPWLNLMVKLKTLDLLPDLLRIKAIKKLLDSAREDVTFAREPDFIALFTEEEWRALRSRIASEYVPDLNLTVDDFKLNYDSQYGSPAHQFSTLTDYCNVAEELFSTEPSLIALIADRRFYLEDVIAELESSYDDTANDRWNDESYGVTIPTETEQGTRDVFEDVADPN
jgi:hypothetical protein